MTKDLQYTNKFTKPEPKPARLIFFAFRMPTTKHVTALKRNTKLKKMTRFALKNVLLPGGSNE